MKKELVDKCEILFLIGSSKQADIMKFCTSSKPPSQPKVAELNKRIVKWIIKSNRPINIVEDSDLKEILQLALGSSNYSLPSRKTVTRKIFDLYDSQRQIMIEKLRQAEFISLTGDFWTSASNESYLGITAHWIDQEWNFASSVLQVKEVSEKHTGQQCTREFLQTADEWEISDKIVGICTDNGRNIVMGVENSLFENFRCAAHTLQLSVGKALKDANINDLLAKCRSIVGHFKRSPQNWRILQKKLAEKGLPPTTLKQDVVTRWNSTLIMIKSCLSSKDALRDVLEEMHFENLTDSEWEQLEKLSQVLEPCREITQLLGGEKYATLSMVIPATEHLKLAMKPSDMDPLFITRFKKSLVVDLESRVSGWGTICTYYEAVALDPRFKTCICLPEFTRDSIWKSLDQKCAKSNKRPQPEIKKRKLLFSHTEGTANASAEFQEVIFYKNMPELDDDYADPLQWWRKMASQLPSLSHLAKKTLCIPATSVPSERLFSKAGLLVTKKRASLHPDNVNKLLCLQSWME